MRNLFILSFFLLFTFCHYSYASDRETELFDYSSEEVIVESIENIGSIEFVWEDNKSKVKADDFAFCMVLVTWSTSTSSGSAGVACEILWDFIFMLLM